MAAWQHSCVHVIHLLLYAAGVSGSCAKEAMEGGGEKGEGRGGVDNVGGGCGDGMSTAMEEQLEHLRARMAALEEENDLLALSAAREPELIADVKRYAIDTYVGALCCIFGMYHIDTHRNKSSVGIRDLGPYIIL